MASQYPPLDDNVGFVPAGYGQQQSTDFGALPNTAQTNAQGQPYPQQAQQAAPTPSTARRFANRDSFFGGNLNVLQMTAAGSAGSRQSTAIPTPTSAQAPSHGFVFPSKSQRRAKDSADNVSITSTSKDYIGGVMSKLSNAFSKAKHAVSGKEASSAGAPPSSASASSAADHSNASSSSSKRSKWGLPSASRRASVSSHAPSVGIPEEAVTAMHSPNLPALPSESTSMYSRNEEAEDGVEGLISLSLYDDQMYPCFTVQPTKSGYLYRCISSRANMGRRTVDDPWELVWVEVRGTYVVFYRDADGEGPSNGHSKLIPLHYMVLTSSTAVETVGSNPLLVRLGLPRHIISLRSQSRGDAAMIDWGKCLLERAVDATKAEVSPTVGEAAREPERAVEAAVVAGTAVAVTVSTVGRQEPAELLVPSLAASPVSPARSSSLASAGTQQPSPYSAPTPQAFTTAVAATPQPAYASTAVDWNSIAGPTAAAATATVASSQSGSSSSSGKKQKDKGKNKEAAANEAGNNDATYMSRWFGIGNRWKESASGGMALAPSATAAAASVGDAGAKQASAPVNVDTAKLREELEADREKWKNMGKRNKKEREEHKGRTVDGRSFKNRLYGVAGSMMSKDDSYIITRKPWAGSTESASGEGAAAAQAPVPVVATASAIGTTTLANSINTNTATTTTTTHQRTSVSPIAEEPGQQLPVTSPQQSIASPQSATSLPSARSNRMSSTMAIAGARQSSPTRQSTGADLESDASPITWAQRTVRREPSIMTATTGNSMSRRRKVVDSPVDNRHSIGDGRGSIGGDNRHSIGDNRHSIGTNRHSLATSNYSRDPTIPEVPGGIDLDNLPPVPVWLRKCVALVDEIGLDQEGIYRVSGNSSTVQALKRLFAERGDEIELLLPTTQSPKASEELKSTMPPTSTISIPIRQRPPSYHRRSMSFSGIPHHMLPTTETPSALPADPRLLYDNDIHVITGVIKSFLRDGFGPGKEPLIESRLYDRFLEVARVDDYRARMIALQDVVHNMSVEHFSMLKHIAEHLARVAQNSHINRMTSRNLAIVFAPTLMMKSAEPGSESQSSTALAMNRLLVEAPVLSTVLETLIDYAGWVFGPIEFEEEEGAAIDEEGPEFADGENNSVAGSAGVSKELPQRMSRISMTSEHRFRAQRSSIGDDFSSARPLSFEKHPEMAMPSGVKRDSVQWEADEDSAKLREALRRDRRNDNDSLYRRKLRNRTQHLALDQWESLPEISSAAHVNISQAQHGPGDRAVGLRWSWTPANNARDYGLSSSAEGTEAPIRPSRFSGAPEPRHRENRDREENEVVSNWRRSINSTHTTASTPSRKSIGSASKRSNRPQSEVFIARPPSIAEGSHRSSLVLSEA